MWLGHCSFGISCHLPRLCFPLPGIRRQPETALPEKGVPQTYLGIIAKARSYHQKKQIFRGRRRAYAHEAGVVFSRRGKNNVSGLSDYIIIMPS
jgi:hypothetical protein